MKDNAIRKMGRAELLELLIQCTDEKEALQAQLDQAKAELAEARRQLNERSAERTDRDGEAAAQMSGRLEDVHALALQCLEEIRALRNPVNFTQPGTETEQHENESGNETLIRRRRRGTGL